MKDAPEPIRLTLSRKKGFDLQKVSLEANGLTAVNCARPSRWGNPFPVNSERNVFEAVEQFKDILETGGIGYLNADNIRRELRCKNLACWCKTSPCHCDVLLEIANR